MENQVQKKLKPRKKASVAKGTLAQHFPNLSKIVQRERVAYSQQREVTQKDIGLVLDAHANSATNTKERMQSHGITYAGCADGNEFEEIQQGNVDTGFTNSPVLAYNWIAPTEFSKTVTTGTDEDAVSTKTVYRDSRGKYGKLNYFTAHFKNTGDQEVEIVATTPVCENGGLSIAHRAYGFTNNGVRVASLKVAPSKTVRYKLSAAYLTGGLSWMSTDLTDVETEDAKGRVTAGRAIRLFDFAAKIVKPRDGSGNPLETPLNVAKMVSVSCQINYDRIPPHFVETESTNVVVLQNRNHTTVAASQYMTALLGVNSIDISDVTTKVKTKLHDLHLVTYKSIQKDGVQYVVLVDKDGTPVDASGINVRARLQAPSLGVVKDKKIVTRYIVYKDMFVLASDDTPLKVGHLQVGETGNYVTANDIMPFFDEAGSPELTNINWDGVFEKFINTLVDIGAALISTI